MEIFDFTTNRRSYLISKCADIEVDYKFYYNSGRKIYLTENAEDLADAKQYCSEILSNKIAINNLNDMKDRDFLVVTSVSMFFKEYQKEAFDFINLFRGKMVAVDYAWDAGRKMRKRGKNRLRREIDALAVLGPSSPYPMRILPYSQPEIDIFAHVGYFMDREDIINGYGLPKSEKYVLITSHTKYDALDALVKYMQRKEFRDTYFIWKLKEKSAGFAKRINKAMSKRGFTNYKLVIHAPDSLRYNKNKSYTNMFSPIAHMSVLIDGHINLSPVSFTHAEMIRAGVPTYGFNSSGISKPRMGAYLENIYNIFWEQDSINKYYGGSPYFSRKDCVVKVDDLFCTRNFINNLKEYI